MQIPPPKGGPQAPPDNNQQGAVELTGGQIFGIAVIVAATVAASRGRVDPGKAEKAIRFGAKSIVGTGALHLSTTISGHGNPPSFKTTPIEGTLAQQVSGQVSPSNRYIYISNAKGGEKVRVPYEIVQLLIDAGLIRPKGKGGAKGDEINMENFWLADP